MQTPDNGEDDDGGGFDADDWSRLAPFAGRVATLEDVQARRAVFALGDSESPGVIDMDLPQPVIWWDDDGEQGAVAVQAERHAGADGEAMDVLGLILPDGDSVVALMDDVDLVDDTDPHWRRLVEEAIDPGAADDWDPFWKDQVLDDPARIALLTHADPDVAARLAAIQAAVQRRVPAAVPCVGYRMPAFRLRRVFFYFAGFKGHIGVYPPVREPSDLIERLAPYRGPKGNLSFPHKAPLPLELIGEVAERLAQEYAD